MLVTLKEILKIAREKKIAIGSFNTPNVTSIKAVISAAEELSQPVIIMQNGFRAKKPQNVNCNFLMNQTN